MSETDCIKACCSVCLQEVIVRDGGTIIPHNTRGWTDGAASRQLSRPVKCSGRETEGGKSFVCPSCTGPGCSICEQFSGETEGKE